MLTVSTSAIIDAAKNLKIIYKMIFSFLDEPATHTFRPSCAVPPPSSRQTRLPRGTRGTYFEILEPGVPRLYRAKNEREEKEKGREREGEGEGRKKNTARSAIGLSFQVRFVASWNLWQTGYPLPAAPTALPAARVVQARRYRHERLSRGVSSLCPPCNSPLRFPVPSLNSVYLGRPGSGPKLPRNTAWEGGVLRQV